MRVKNVHLFLEMQIQRFTHDTAYLSALEVKLTLTVLFCLIVFCPRNDLVYTFLYVCFSNTFHGDLLGYFRWIAAFQTYVIKLR